MSLPNQPKAGPAATHEYVLQRWTHGGKIKSYVTNVLRIYHPHVNTVIFPIENGIEIHSDGVCQGPPCHAVPEWTCEEWRLQDVFSSVCNSMLFSVLIHFLFRLLDRKNITETDFYVIFLALGFLMRLSMSSLHYVFCSAFLTSDTSLPSIMFFVSSFKL